MIKVPYFKKEDWLKLKETSLDTIPGTYESYINNLNKGLKEYNKDNDEIKRIAINVNELIKYLKSNNLPNISDNRAFYINEKITNRL